MFKGWFKLGFGLSSGIAVVVLLSGFVAFTSLVLYLHAEEKYQVGQLSEIVEKGSKFIDDALAKNIKNSLVESFGVSDAARMNDSIVYLASIFKHDKYYDICHDLSNGVKNWHKDGYEADIPAVAYSLAQRAQRPDTVTTSFLSFFGSNADVIDESAKKVDLSNPASTTEAAMVDAIRKEFRIQIQRALAHPERALFGQVETIAGADPQNYRLGIAVDVNGDGSDTAYYYSEITLLGGGRYVVHYAQRGAPPQFAAQSGQNPASIAQSFEGQDDQAMSVQSSFHAVRIDPDTGEPVDVKKSHTPGFAYAPQDPGNDPGYATRKITPR